MGSVHGAFGLAADGEQVCSLLTDLTFNHTHSVEQVDQSGDAESHEPIRGG